MKPNSETKVVEHDGDGKEIWSIDVSGNQHGYVREVNSKRETVWEINKSDLPGIPLYS